MKGPGYEAKYVAACVITDTHTDTHTHRTTTVPLAHVPRVNKLSGSLEREDALLIQSKLEGESPSNNKLCGSLERKDDSLMQRELKDEAMSDDKPLESDDALLKQNELEDEILSDNKPSLSIERNNDLLKHSGLEADQPTAGRLDSVPSKRTKQITSLTQKGKTSTGKHIQISFFSHIHYCM